MIRKEVRPALVCLLVMTAVTGVLYPLAVTGVARVAFPREASGSLVEANGRAVGSELVGQPFDDPRYFWGRPSATSTTPYNGTASGGSNLGPTNPALVSAVEDRVKNLRAQHPGQTGRVPVDLVTASASGLDPHISPAAAEFQVVRVAGVRGVPPDAVRAAVRANTEGRTLGVLGEPRVNVLKLNLALDAGTR